MIVNTLRYILVNDTKTNEIINGRCFAVKIPQSELETYYKQPCLILLVSNIEPQQQKLTFNGFLKITIEIHATGRNYLELQRLVTATILALGQPIDIPNQGPDLQSIVFISGGQENWNNELEMFVQILTFEARVQNLQKIFS